MLLIILFALLGHWLGGFSGLIIGAALGYLIFRARQAALSEGLRVAPSQLIESTFAVVGALCKADGVVTRDEIRVVEELFVRLQLSLEQKEAAKAAFNRGKAPDFERTPRSNGLLERREASAFCTSCSCKSRSRPSPPMARCTRRSTRCSCAWRVD